jgi:hypothetical protein
MEQLAALKNGAIKEPNSPPWPALGPLISPYFSTNVEHVSQFEHLEQASPGIYDADSDIDNEHDNRRVIPQISNAVEPHL